MGSRSDGIPLCDKYGQYSISIQEMKRLILDYKDVALNYTLQWFSMKLEHCLVESVFTHTY